MLLLFCFIFQELEPEFEFVGNGWCLSRCHVMGKPCSINKYYRFSSNIDECQLVCKNEVACTGFMTRQFKDNSTACYIHGNISSVDVDNWTNPDAWYHLKGKSTYGYESFKINSFSKRSSAFRCFRRLDEETNKDGKF